MWYDNNDKINVDELLNWLDTKHVKIDHLRELFSNRVVKVALDHLEDWTAGRGSRSTKGYIEECSKLLKATPDDKHLDPRRTLRIYKTLEHIRRAREYRELPV